MKVNNADNVFIRCDSRFPLPLGAFFRGLGDPPLWYPFPLISPSSGGSERGLDVFERGLPKGLVEPDGPAPFSPGGGVLSSRELIAS